MSYVIERRPKQFNWRGLWCDCAPKQWRRDRAYDTRRGRELAPRNLRSRPDGYEYRRR